MGRGVQGIIGQQERPCDHEWRIRSPVCTVDYSTAYRHFPPPNSVPGRKEFIIIIYLHAERSDVVLWNFNCLLAIHYQPT